MSTDHGRQQETDGGKVVGQIEPQPATAGLDPALDPARWERMVGRVMAAADSELARRRRPGTLDLLGQWMRPVMAAAASVAVIASAALLSIGSNVDVAEATVPTLAEAILTTDLADWVDSGEVPEVQSLLETFGGSEP
jgi:hypothetical protein